MKPHAWCPWTLVWMFSSLGVASDQVLIVDELGSGFTDIQPAIDAAADGDTVVVRSGFYGDFVIMGKSLTVVGDGAPTVGPFRVQSTAADQVVTIRGLRSEGIILAVVPLGEVRDCLGPVHLEQVVVDYQFLHNDVPFPALSVRDSHQVTLTRCELLGRDGVGSSNEFIYGLQGSNGVEIDDASVFAYDCTIRGGNGGNGGVPVFGGPINSTAGGAGVTLRGGAMMFASGCDIAGGDGGDASESAPGLCDIPGSTAGDAIFVFGGVPSTLTVQDCVLAAGETATAPAGCPPSGGPGETIDNNGGVVTLSAEPYREVSLSSPTREGQATMLSVTGQPGESLVLLVSTQSQVNTVSGLLGVLVPASPWTVVLLGPLPASGEVQFGPAIPGSFLPPGCDALDVIVQGAFGATLGGVVTSSPTVLTVLAAGL